jgi:hypothetical protein
MIGLLVDREHNGEGKGQFGGIACIRRVRA